MDHIALRKAFALIDASDTDDIANVLPKLTITGTPTVTLDLSNCIIDYPVTSKLIDRVLEQIFALNGAVKQLNIIHNHAMELKYTLNSLFNGSRFLEAKALGMEFETLESEVNKTLENHGLTVVLSFMKRDGSVLTEYRYGARK